MSDYTPTTAEVAAKVRARVVEPGGNEPNDFTAETRPTLDQVTALLPDGHRAVASKIGANLCDSASDLEADGKGLAAIYVAMEIEQSFYPEQTRDAGSSFQSLMQLWKDGISALKENVDDQCGPGEGGEGQEPHAFFDEEPLFGRTYPAAW